MKFRIIKFRKFIEKCERWDYLTIPSDYVGEIAQSAYRFNKQLLKTGYPRNDSLFNYSEELRLSIPQLLSIAQKIKKSFYMLQRGV